MQSEFVTFSTMHVQLYNVQTENTGFLVKNSGKAFFPFLSQSLIWPVNVFCDCSLMLWRSSEVSGDPAPDLALSVLNIPTPTPWPRQMAECSISHLGRRRRGSPGGWVGEWTVENPSQWNQELVGLDHRRAEAPGSQHMLHCPMGHHLQDINLEKKG